MLMYHFFFVKQKTSYEMRISDWSSDVCSADLGPEDADRQEGDNREQENPQAEPRSLMQGGLDLGGEVEVAPALGGAHEANSCSAAPAVDRKSVVQGKSVSVRVDLGGRRNLKKQNTMYNTNVQSKLNYTI